MNQYQTKNLIYKIRDLRFEKIITQQFSAFSVELFQKDKLRELEIWINEFYISDSDENLEAALIEKEALEQGWRQEEINGVLCWIDRDGKRDISLEMRISILRHT